MAPEKAWGRTRYQEITDWVWLLWCKLPSHDLTEALERIKKKNHRINVFSSKIRNGQIGFKDLKQNQKSTDRVISPSVCYCLWKKIKASNYPRESKALGIPRKRKAGTRNFPDCAMSISVSLPWSPSKPYSFSFSVLCTQLSFIGGSCPWAC